MYFFIWRDYQIGIVIRLRNLRTLIATALSIVAVVAWIMTSNAAAVLAQEHAQSSISGTWIGHYRCGQGRTELQLSLASSGTSTINGVFAFSATPENPAVPSGSFKILGRFNARSGTIVGSPGGGSIAQQATSPSRSKAG